MTKGESRNKKDVHIFIDKKFIKFKIQESNIYQNQLRINEKRKDHSMVETWAILCFVHGHFHVFHQFLFVQIKLQSFQNFSPFCSLVHKRYAFFLLFLS